MNFRRHPNTTNITPGYGYGYSYLPQPSTRWRIYAICVAVSGGHISYDKFKQAFYTATVDGRVIPLEMIDLDLCLD
jgi:hypothetical protein